MSIQKTDVLDLFSSAVAVDGLDNTASDILVDNLNAVALAGCVGVDLDQLGTDDVTLVAVLLDGSGSMHPVMPAVIDGYNTLIEALADSQQADSILLSAWTFDTSSELLFGYTPVGQLHKMPGGQYGNGGGTALYDTLLDVTTGLVAYGQSLRDNGVRTRGVIVVFSDGEDNSSRHTSHEVQTVSQSLLAQETYTLAYAGFGSSDLQAVAAALGFPSLITAASQPSEIRRIFQQVSRSVIRASQSSVGLANNFF